jgi:hypothetical protein
MSRPKITIKAKRNNFTLSIQAQSIIDRLDKNKSKFVTEAIIKYYEYERRSN